MRFEEVDESDIQALKLKYSEEVKVRWGHTEEYADFIQKDKNKTDKDWKDSMQRYEEIMSMFAGKVGQDPHNGEVQALVQWWRDYITETSYQCTKEVLSGLGIMYVQDERFKNNIDKFGVGTAQLLSDAIKVYCQLDS